MIAQLPTWRKLRLAVFHVKHYPVDLKLDGFTWNLQPVLFTDAEPGKNFTQQVVRREFAGNGAQGFMCQPQFFGIQLELPGQIRCNGKVALRSLQSLDMPRPGGEQVLP